MSQDFLNFSNIRWELKHSRKPHIYFDNICCAACTSMGDASTFAQPNFTTESWVKCIRFDVKCMRFDVKWMWFDVKWMWFDVKWMRFDVKCVRFFSKINQASYFFQTMTNQDDHPYSYNFFNYTNYYTQITTKYPVLQEQNTRHL